MRARVNLGVASFLANLVFASACGDHPSRSHSHAKRTDPSQWSITPPTRPLEWGDINVLHTTDTHGFLLGHQHPSAPEPNYSGTLGDFADFVRHMKFIAEEQRGVDLLLVDSGDVHDGTGLSDGFPSGGVDAHETNQFLKQLPYDLLAIGNHELYVYNNTLDTYHDFAPHWNGRYLSSNVNITVTVLDPADALRSRNISVPVGERYTKFTTKFGRRVTSLGVLFDFTGNDEGTTVQKVEDMVKEQWFADAIADEPDLFLLVGHMPVHQEDNWPTVFDAIRTVHPTTPILIFGGHTHIRDCVQYDGRSMALESGRYMETVGWMSVKFDNKSSSSGSAGNLTFSRRYLDTNRVTYEYHTARDNDTFDTLQGRAITQGLEDLAKRFDLNLTYGVAPRDYSISRDPYPSNGSSLSLYIEQAVPVVLTLNNTSNTSLPALFLTNSGSQRFDIFKGAFTKNDQLTASPFADPFLFVSGVPFGIARRVVGVLNEVGGEVPTTTTSGSGNSTTATTAASSGFVTPTNATDSSNTKRDGKKEKRKRRKWMEELYKRGEVEIRYRAWLEDMYVRATRELERRTDEAEEPLTLGYVTSDSCPGVGDDTPHIALPFFSTPDYTSSIDSLVSNSTNTNSTDPVTSLSPLSETGLPPDDTPIDLVFVDFIQSDVLDILNELSDGSGGVYTQDDVGKYSDLLSNEVLGLFAQEVWN